MEKGNKKWNCVGNADQLDQIRSKKHRRVKRFNPRRSEGNGRGRRREGNDTGEMRKINSRGGMKAITGEERERLTGEERTLKKSIHSRGRKISEK